MKILSLGHKKRVGKDTAARFMLTELSIVYPKIKAVRVSYADPLKEEAYRLYSWGGLERGMYYENNPQYKDSILPLLGKSPRQIWIELGELVRNVNLDTWIKLAFKSCNADIAIVTDLRHKNEADWTKIIGGWNVNVIRPIEDTRDVADDWLRSYDCWDYILHNGHDIRTLSISCANLLDTFLTKFNFK